MTVAAVTEIISEQSGHTVVPLVSFDDKTVTSSEPIPASYYTVSTAKSPTTVSPKRDSSPIFYASDFLLTSVAHAPEKNPKNAAVLPTTTDHAVDAPHNIQVERVGHRNEIAEAGRIEISRSSSVSSTSADGLFGSSIFRPTEKLEEAVQSHTGSKSHTYKPGPRPHF